MPFGPNVLANTPLAVTRVNIDFDSTVSADHRIRERYFREIEILELRNVVLGLLPFSTHRAAPGWDQ